jgi:hypothetical protein
MAEGQAIILSNKNKMPASFPQCAGDTPIKRARRESIQDAMDSYCHGNAPFFKKAVMNLVLSKNLYR